MTRARDVANLIGSGNYSSTTFTATAGQTAFTISHTQGFIQVFMNGLLLDETADYTSNGSAVTLTSGAAAGDEIEVVKYNTFSVGDALNQAAADTRYVNTTGDTMSGDLTISSTAGQLKLTDTDGTEQNTTIKQSGGTFFLQARDNTNNAPIVFAGNGGGNYDEHLRILAGGGITFNGDTATANALDDYEEGTWTPVITATGGSTNATMTVGGNQYTKVGSLVVANAYLSSVNMGAITNGTYFILSGFPYVAREYADFSISYKDGGHSDATTISGGYVQKNTSYAYFVTANNGAEPQQTSSAAFTRAMITFVYLTT